MQQSEFLLAVANALPGVSRNVISEVLHTAAEVTAEMLALKVDKSVAVPGFGKFKPRTRLPRLGRHPVTGREISIPGQRVAQFAPSKTFREIVAGKG